MAVLPTPISAAYHKGCSIKNKTPNFAFTTELKQRSFNGAGDMKKYEIKKQPKAAGRSPAMNIFGTYVHRNSNFKADLLYKIFLQIFQESY